MKDINLFGEMQEYQDDASQVGPVKAKKMLMDYRSARMYEYDRACEFCENLIRKTYHGKKYSKCVLIGDSNSEATDIKKSYTCKYFKRKEINA